MSLNAEQTDLVNRGINAKNPFDIGPCLSIAFNALKKDIFTIVLGYLVMIVVSAIAVCTVLGILILPGLTLGFTRFHLKAVRNQNPSLSDIFDGFDMLSQSIALLLVHSILVVIAFFPCFLPGVYLAVAWSLAWFYFCDKKYGFWECMEISRRVVTANWGWAFLLLIASAIISYVGLIACIVGVLFTMPLHILMIAAAYTRAVDTEDKVVNI